MWHKYFFLLEIRVLKANTNFSEQGNQDLDTIAM
jgi:hypothetical protein